MNSRRFLLLIIVILILLAVYLLCNSYHTSISSVEFTPPSSSEIILTDKSEPGIFNNEGAFVRLEEIMPVEADQLRSIAEEAELEAMLFDENYYTDFSETHLLLEGYGFLEGLSEEDQCKRVLKLMERAKCPKNKRKYFKQIVKKVQLGGFKVQNKFPFIIFPGWSKYSDEVNRLNLVMEYYYRNQQRYCHIVQQCELAKYTVYCNALRGVTTPDIINDEHKRCINILLGDRTEDLVRILSEMGSTLDKIRSTPIDSVIGKEALAHKVNDLEALKNKQEEELTTAERDLSNEVQKDSIQKDSIHVTKDTITAEKDTINLKTSK